MCCGWMELFIQQENVSQLCFCFHVCLFVNNPCITSYKTETGIVTALKFCFTFTFLHQMSRQNFKAIRILVSVNYKENNLFKNKQTNMKTKKNL